MKHVPGLNGPWLILAYNYSPCLRNLCVTGKNMVLWLISVPEVLLVPLCYVLDLAKMWKYGWNWTVQNIWLVQILTSNICVVQWERKKVAGILPDVPSSCTYRYPSLLLHYTQVCGAHYARSRAESQETKVTLKEGKQNIWQKCIWAAYPEDHYLQSGSVHCLLHLLWATDTDKRSKDLIFSSLGHRWHDALSLGL